MIPDAPDREGFSRWLQTLVNVMAGLDPIGARINARSVFSLIVIPAKAGTHGAASACGSMDSRFRGNDECGDLGSNILILAPMGSSPAMT